MIFAAFKKVVQAPLCIQILKLIIMPVIVVQAGMMQLSCVVYITNITPHSIILLTTQLHILKGFNLRAIKLIQLKNANCVIYIERVAEKKRKHIG